MHRLKKNVELSGHAGPIYDLDFDGTFIYSTSSDKFVVRWNIETGQQDKFAIKMDVAAYSICCISDQFLIVGATDGKLYVFDTVKRIELKCFTQHTKAIFSIEYNSILNHFYVGDSDGNLTIWDASSFELLNYLPFDCGKIRSLKVDENGSKLAIAAQDGQLRVLDLTTLNEVINVETNNTGVNSVVFSNQSLFVAGRNARIKELTENGTIIKSIDAHNYGVYDLILLDNNSVLVSASFDKSIKVWNTNLTIIERIEYKNGGHKSAVNGLVKLSENRFASCSDDKKIIVWSLES